MSGQTGSTECQDWGMLMVNTDRDASSAMLLQGYIEESEYCRQRGISPRTAQRERHLRQGPPYVRLGQRVYYRVEAVQAWIRQREVEPARNRNTRRG